MTASKKINFFNHYDKLALSILQKKDYKSLYKFFRYLNYTSVGEYIKIERDEFEKVLLNPTFFYHRTFYKKLNAFRMPSTRFPDLRKLYRLPYFDLHFDNLLNKLEYGLIRNRFENSNESFNELVVYSNRHRALCSYLAGKGVSKWNYQAYIEARLEEKRIFDFECESNDMDFIQKGITNDRSIPIPVSSDIQLFLQLINEMHARGFIENSDHLQLVFTKSGKFIPQKVLWLKKQQSLIYFLELLYFAKKVVRPKNKWQVISNYFILSDYEVLSTDSLSSQWYTLTLTNDKKMYDVLELLAHKQDEEMRAIINAFNKVYGAIGTSSY